MSNDKVLDDKDIKKIWKSVRSVSLEDAERMIKNRGIVKPMTMKNGYFTFLSLDIHGDGRKEYHLSISYPLGIAKFETASVMAREILGDCDQLNVGFRGIYVDIHKTNQDKGKNKEEKINDGKVEGDVNNGIERRIKEEIQTEGVIERSNRYR